MNRAQAAELPTSLEGPTGSLLEVIDLKTYFDTPRGTAKAVDGVTFSLDRGRTLGVVGESGSGKSVLSRSIMNLLPRRAAQLAGGEVLFEGRNLRHLDRDALRRIWGREIAMIFQDPMTSLNPVVKIGRQITESLRHNLDLGKKAARDRAISLLRAVGLPAPERQFDEYPHQLSGGMRQRVTIAIALACGPKLLLADEPTTALDVTIQKQILELLQTQQRERNMAMVLVSHDLGVVAGRTDEIIVMYAGQIVERAPTRTLFAHTRHPYTEALLRSIPRLQSPSHSLLEVIPGRPPDVANLPAHCRFAVRCNYAQPHCLEHDPDLTPGAQAGHEYRCFFPVGTPQGRDALMRNLERGRTAAGTMVGPSAAVVAG